MLMGKALLNFKQMNGTYPERVILYRDGIGSGKMKGICSIEIEQIYQAFAEIECEIELLYVVANKRTNLEIYAQGLYEDDSYKNVVSGTVLDHHSGIASAGSEHQPVEFYLISQGQKQGMNYPCKYSIVHDTIGEDLGKVELLTYKLCHLYFNYGGAIRIPAPI
jgi:aubergine-like protein